MGFAVKLVLTMAFAALQTVAPWLCCCSGARVFAAVRTEFVANTAKVEPLKKSADCCSKKDVPTDRPAFRHTSDTCSGKEPTPSPNGPAKKHDCCVKLVSIDSALPEAVVLPDHSDSITFLGAIDAWFIEAESSLSARATSADPPPERLSPLHVRIRAHHAMRC
jgi:hypothetical protein